MKQLTSSRFSPSLFPRFYRSTGCAFRVDLEVSSNFVGAELCVLVCSCLRPATPFIDIDFYILFLGFRPNVGRNHLFSYPPFFGFFCRIPTALCRTRSAALIISLECFPFYFLKVSNIFCLFLSFCAFIIAQKMDLSRGF